MIKAGVSPPPAQQEKFIHKHAATLAALPVMGIALLFYFGSTIWSVLMSFTASKIFPDMTFVGLRQYGRLFRDNLWSLSLSNLAIFALGSLLSLVLDFILTVLLEGDVPGAGAFRTIYLAVTSILVSARNAEQARANAGLLTAEVPDGVLAELTVLSERALKLVPDKGNPLGYNP